jgi:hypothetical protein
MKISNRNHDQDRHMISQAGEEEMVGSLRQAGGGVRVCGVFIWAERSYLSIIRHVDKVR